LLKQSFLVDNQAGGGGVIACQATARAAPDGYTLLQGYVATHGTSPATRKVPYDAIKDFSPIGMIGGTPNVLVVNAALPVKNIKEFIDYIKKNPGKLSYGSAGAGGINHLVLETLKARSGIFITHIPYRGIAPATLDMISGQIQLVTGTIPALAPFVREGRVKALAVTTAKRSSALPLVPSMAESGFADFDVLNYFGLVAPKGTPEAVVERLSDAVAKVVKLPEVLARFQLDSIEPSAQGPQSLGRFLAQDLSGWQKVVAAQGIKLDSV
jgi:tripartite-type tricarboxylate transporter receptor subunit TctC